MAGRKGPAAGRSSSERAIARWVLLGLIVATGAGVTALSLSSTSSGEANAVSASAVPPPVCPEVSPPTPNGSATQFESPPTRPIDLEKAYVVTIRTSCGDMKVDLDATDAPVAASNFIALTRRGFFNGLTWNRVIFDFLIQSGDPDSDLTTLPDGPGYTLEDRISTDAEDYTYGSVGFINMGSEGFFGSQFFIIVHDLQGALSQAPSPLPQRSHVMFGRVRERYFGTLNAISKQPTMGGTNPLEKTVPRVPIYIESVEIAAARAKR